MLKYEITTKLRTSDYDKYDRIKMYSILDVFQDLAGDHAEELNIGYSLMKEKKLIWVLVSQEVRIVGNVPYGKEVTLRTWPAEKGRADFIRYYEIETDCGDSVVEAISKWVVVNYETRRIERASEVNYEGEIYSKKPFDGINKLKVNIPHTKQFLKSYKVLNDDIDHNGHMNNANYVKLIYNSIELSKDNYIKNIHIDYLKEAMLGDTIDLYSFEDIENTYYVGYVNLVQVFIASIKKEK